MQRRGASFYVLAVLFVAFLLFMYGPLFVMFVLAFQGPQGGMTLPLVEPGLHWWRSLLAQTEGPLADAIGRSIGVGVLTGAVTAGFATVLAFVLRRPIRGRYAIFFLVLLGMMTPGILLGLGVSLLWRLAGWTPSVWTSGFGVHVIWALPFGLLVMMAVVNRLDPAIEEAARDLGAGRLETFRRVTLPLVWTGIFGAFLFGFTLSWNDFERTVLVASENTLPLEIFALATVRVLDPSLYALGSFTIVVSLVVILGILAVSLVQRRRQARW